MRRFIALVVALTFSIFSSVTSATSALVDTETLIATQMDREADLLKLQKLLETKILKEKLRSVGLTEEEVMQRLKGLDDDQLHHLVSQLDGIRVGGDSGLGLLVTLLVIAILVVILLQLTGHRIVVVEG